MFGGFAIPFDGDSLVLNYVVFDLIADAELEFGTCRGPQARRVQSEIPAQS